MMREVLHEVAIRLANAETIIVHAGHTLRGPEGVEIPFEHLADLLREHVLDHFSVETTWSEPDTGEAWQRSGREPLGGRCRIDIYTSQIARVSSLYREEAPAGTVLVPLTPSLPRLTPARECGEGCQLTAPRESDGARYCRTHDRPVYGYPLPFPGP